MTVADLIDALQKMPKDAKIVVIHAQDSRCYKTGESFGVASKVILHKTYRDKVSKKTSAAVGIY